MKKILVNNWGIVFFYLVILLGVLFYNPQKIKQNTAQGYIASVQY